MRNPMTEFTEGMGKFYLHLAGAVSLIIVAAGIAVALSEFASSGKNEVTMRLAIESGAADIVPDEHGNPTFRWREVEHEAH